MTVKELTTDKLLQESGSFLLQETGSFILLLRKFRKGIAMLLTNKNRNIVTTTTDRHILETKKDKNFITVKINKHILGTKKDKNIL